MKNLYPGKCCVCNKRVRSREGIFEIIPKEERLIHKVYKKWKLKHSQCAVKKENYLLQLA